MKRIIVFYLLGMLLSITSCNNEAKQETEVKPKVIVVLSTDSCLISEFTDKIYDDQIVYYGFHKNVTKIDNYVDLENQGKKMIITELPDSDLCLTFCDTIIIR